MDNLSVCLGLAADNAGLSFPEKYESNYQQVYKPAISYLYAHPECLFTFSFLGEQLEWCRRKHPEFLEIIHSLLRRKQIEILGGGYYDPVFPLLFPLDRSGQVETLSSELRHTFGKRPRGMSLYASIWDPSLTSCFSTCGMEYVELDSSLIPPSKQFYLPLIQSDRGKSIHIVPVYRDFKPRNSEEPDKYLQRIFEKVKNDSQNDKYSGLATTRTITVVFGKHEFAALLKSGWFERLIYMISLDFSDQITLSVPMNCVKNSPIFVPGYVPAGMSADISKWAHEPYTAAKNKETFPVTIQDFLENYTQNHALYDRMLYVSMLVNQCHGDKMRKKAAREKLWEAQNGTAFVCTPKGTLVNSAQRNKAYRALAETERLVRECGEFSESVTSFDYNGDGLREYICQMENYNACIGLKGGSVFELEVMCKTGNYADNLSRMKRFDGFDDEYRRSLFVDHLFDTNDFACYKTHQPFGKDVFAGKQYLEQKFSSQRHEIQLQADGYFKEQKVSLRKHYNPAANGFMVQYILKNESDSLLKTKFVIENNFSQRLYLPDNVGPYNVELISASEKKEISVNSMTLPDINYRDVSIVQITDADNKISFVLEPNEAAEFTCSQIVFKRPDDNDEELSVAGTTFSTALVWDVELSAGMEMEKTINFSIINMRRKRRRKIS
jgi:hypothetical protein